VYSDVYDKYNRETMKLFGLEISKCPDEDTTNADEVYFKSPINLAGYKWYEPSAIDDDNNERYEAIYSGSLNDEVSWKISTEIMNLARLPENFVLSTTLLTPLRFSDGLELCEL